MRVFNITQQNSIKVLCMDFCILSFITLIAFFACIFDMNIITFLILFTVIIIDFVSIVGFYKQRKDYNSIKNVHNLIDYVDFSDNGITIAAFDQSGFEKSISYKYSEIEGINIVLETYDTSMTRKHYTSIRDISVNFYTNDGQVFILHSYHMTFGGNLRSIYKMIEYCKLAKKYTYTLSGTGDHSEIKEKIDYYVKYGKRLNVEPSGRRELKILSIIIFLWGSAMGVIVFAPFFGIYGVILCSLAFLLISILIYLPILFDYENQE